MCISWTLWWTVYQLWEWGTINPIIIRTVVVVINIESIVTKDRKRGNVSRRESYTSGNLWNSDRLRTSKRVQGDLHLNVRRTGLGCPSNGTKTGTGCRLSETPEGSYTVVRDPCTPVKIYRTDPREKKTEEKLKGWSPVVWVYGSVPFLEMVSPPRDSWTGLRFPEPVRSNEGYSGSLNFVHPWDRNKDLWSGRSPGTGTGIVSETQDMRLDGRRVVPPTYLNQVVIITEEREKEVKLIFHKEHSFSSYFLCHF